MDHEYENPSSARRATRAEQRTAVYKISSEARTKEEHVRAAQLLLGLVDPTALYQMTPVFVSMAQVHATLAAAL